MLNERDGGIGGVKLVIEECETGYDTKKGIECYEAVKAKNPVMVNPWSTGITLPLIPRAAVDKIPILSMAYGLSASADGEIFPWVFNPPATYWDGLSHDHQATSASKEGGLDKLKGKKIGYIYLDAGYGREPIPLLEQLAKDYGFEVEVLSDRRAGHAEPVLAMAERPPRQARLHGPVGLGRDERRPPSRKRRAPAIPMDKFYLDLVAGRRRPARDRRAGQGLQDPQLARGRRRTSRPSRTSRSTWSTRA